MTSSTNIKREHRSAFDALLSGRYANFALFSCFVNGKPASAIVALSDADGEVEITPLFVSVTEDMILSDHDGRVA